MRRDHDAEGHLVCAGPEGAPQVVDFGALSKRADYLDLLMSDRLAVSRPASGAPEATQVLDRSEFDRPDAVSPRDPARSACTRVFVAGLNTPVAEANRRAQRYANVLDLRFAQLHNGSRAREGGALCGLVEPKYNDWENAIVSRIAVLRSTLGVLPSLQWKRNNARLVSNIQTLLLDSLDAQRPIELCSYSDSTILAGVAVEGLYRGWQARHAGEGAITSRDEFRRRLDANVTLVAVGSAWSNYRVRMRSRNPVRRLGAWLRGRSPSLYAQVVELHAFGDPARGLGRDVLPTKVGPESKGRFFRRRADNDRAVTVRFPSPYPGFQSHNLALHVEAVKAIFDANGATSFRELYDLGQSGALVMPDERGLLERVLADYDVCRDDRQFWGQAPLPRPLLKGSLTDPDSWSVVQPPPSKEGLGADERYFAFDPEGRAREVPGT